MVNRPSCTILTLLKLSFFIKETSSLTNQVSCGTVIPCIGGEVQEMVSRFGENLHILGPFGGLRPPYHFETT